MIVWGAYLSSHVINTILMIFLLLFSFCGLGLICMFIAKKDDDNADHNKRKKCMPIAFMLMIIFSFMPCFAAFL